MLEIFFIGTIHNDDLNRAWIDNGCQSYGYEKNVLPAGQQHIKYIQEKRNYSVQCVPDNVSAIGKL